MYVPDTLSLVNRLIINSHVLLTCRDYKFMKKKNSFAIPKGQKVLKCFFACNLIALSLFGPAPSVQANTYMLVQNYSLDLSFKNERLSTVLDEISKQSGIKIAYSNAQIAANSRISVKVKTTNIEEALRIVLGENYRDRKSVV